jgi:hypothetical protein
VDGDDLLDRLVAEVTAGAGVDRDDRQAAALLGKAS